MPTLPFLFFSLLSSASAYPPPIEKDLLEATEDCKKNEGGRIGISRKAVQSMDLNGDGKEDYILDYAELTCPTAMSLYSGSAGTTLHIFLTNQKGELQLAWEDNVFGFAIKTADKKKELHVDMKDEDATLIYEAKGTQFVRKEIRKPGPKPSKGR